jgi:hypothetical protein
MNIEEILQNEIVQAGLIGAGVILFTAGFAFITIKLSELKTRNKILEIIKNIALGVALVLLFICISLIVGSVFVTAAK